MKIEYTIKLWLITILLAPFIAGAYEVMNNSPGQVVGILEFFPITLILSIVFSIPTLIIVLLISKLILDLKFAGYLKKIIILLVVNFGIIITLYLIGGSLIDTLIVSYCLSAIMATLILMIQIPTVKEKLPESNK